MKKSGLTDEMIAGILCQHRAGVSTTEPTGHGISVSPAAEFRHARPFPQVGKEVKAMREWK